MELKTLETKSFKTIESEIVKYINGECLVNCKNDKKIIIDEKLLVKENAFDNAIKELNNESDLANENIKKSENLTRILEFAIDYFNDKKYVAKLDEVNKDINNLKEVIKKDKKQILELINKKEIFLKKQKEEAERIKEIERQKEKEEVERIKAINRERNKEIEQEKIVKEKAAKKKKTIIIVAIILVINLPTIIGLFYLIYILLRSKL